MNRKSVWVRKKLFEGDFVAVERAVVNSYRLEYRNLGSANIRILAKNPNELEVNFATVVPGDYIFIMEGDKAPESTLDGNILWWGYCEATGMEYSKGFNNHMGDITCLQIGHRLKKEIIKYTKSFTHFNPQAERGTFIGNKENNTLRIKDFGTKLAQLETHYWTLDEAVNYALGYVTGDFSFDTDFSKVPEKKVKTYESLESGDGKDPLTWLDSVLGNLVYIFELKSEAAITLTYLDPTKNEEEEKEIDIPDDAATVFITKNDDRYKKVTLVGDKIQVNFSVSTYNAEDKFISLGRDWDEDDEYSFMQPDVTIPSTEKLVEGEILTFFPDAGERQAAAIKFIEDNMQDLRSNDKNTYQKFKWKLGKNKGTEEGNSLYQNVFPGSTLTQDPIYVFPEFKLFNDDLTPRLTLFTDETKDMTPPLTELQFLPQINYEFDSDKFINPSLWYRALSSFKEYDGQDHWVPYWYNGTEPKFGGLSAQLEIDYTGIRLNIPYPEALACGDGDLYRDWINGELSDDYNDGLQRGEWSTEDKSASTYDPEYYGSDSDVNALKAGIGHWGRLVFSLAAYSSQKLELTKENPFYPNGLDTKELVIEDPSFRVIINRLGFVQGIKKSEHFPNEANVLEWNINDTIVRSDAVEFKSYFDELYDYHTKEKSAVRIERRITNANFLNERLEFDLNIGDYIKKVKDGDILITTNSAIASIEWVFEGSNPRIIVQTEIPASPISTRERKVKLRV